MKVLAMHPSLLTALILPALFSVSAVPSIQENDAHPWASFPPEAWVDVHSELSLVVGETEAKKWSSDSRLTLAESSDDSVTIGLECEEFEMSAKIEVAIPLGVDLPGVRSVGYWPFDIQASGDASEKPDMIVRGDASSSPEATSEVLRKEPVEVGGTSFEATVTRLTWKEEDHDYELVAWITEEFEVPAKWTLQVDGMPRSGSMIVEADEEVLIGKEPINCIVTETVASLAVGVLTERSWSSSEIPGFLVRMESQVVADGFTFVVNQVVSAFSATGDEEAEEEGNPPGSRPALGIMPEYGSGESGLLVGGVREDGPADVAGIMAGDLIFEIDGHSIEGIEDYMEVMSELLIGKDVSVKIERSGREYDLTIEVGERER